MCAAGTGCVLLRPFSIRLISNERAKRHNSSALSQRGLVKSNVEVGQLALDKKARRITLIVAVVLIAGATALLLDQQGLEQGSPQGPSGTRVDQRTPGNSATRDAADLSEVRGAVDQLHDTLSKDPLQEIDWQAAEQEAQEIMQRWVSFKTPMRANAGDQMWTTSDVNQFDQSVKDVRTQVQDRDANQARESVEDMQRLIEKYDHTRRGRLQTGSDD